MKKLLVALILAVVLSLTLVTPALAYDPPPVPENGPINMPGSGEAGLDNASNNTGRCLPWGGGWGSFNIWVHMKNIVDGYAPGWLNNYLWGRGNHKNSD